MLASARQVSAGNLLEKIWNWLRLCHRAPNSSPGQLTMPSLALQLVKSACTCGAQWRQAQMLMNSAETKRPLYVDLQQTPSSSLASAVAVCMQAMKHGLPAFLLS